MLRGLRKRFQSQQDSSQTEDNVDESLRVVRVPGVGSSSSTTALAETTSGATSVTAVVTTPKASDAARNNSSKTPHKSVQKSVAIKSAVKSKHNHNNTSKTASTRKSNKKRALLWKTPVSELLAPADTLHKWDVAIRTSDEKVAAALEIPTTSNATTISAQEQSSSSLPFSDSTTKLIMADPGVLVAPSGELLLIPAGPQQLVAFGLADDDEKTGKSKHGSDGGESKTDSDENDNNGGGNAAPTKSEQTTAKSDKTAEVPTADSKPMASLVDSMDDDEEEDDNGNNGTRSEKTDNSNNIAPSFAALLEQNADDYIASMFVGHDDQGTPQDRNGFSGRGWSTTATTYALDQTQQTLQHLLDYSQRVVQSRQTQAADGLDACQAWRQHNPSMGGQAPSPPTTATDRDWEVVHGGGGGWWSSASSPSSTTTTIHQKAEELDVHAPSRCGPLLHGGSSLNAVLVSMEMYHRQVAEAENKVWNAAASPTTTNNNNKRATPKEEIAGNPDSVIAKLERTVEELAHRRSERQEALLMTQQRASIMEERLAVLKKQRDDCWSAVYAAEDTVSQRMEELLAAKSRRYEQDRLQQLRQQAKTSKKEAPAMSGAAAALHEKNKASQEDIWNMVNNLSDNLDMQGGFEPVSFSPRATMKSMDDAPNSAAGDAKQSTSLLDAENDGASETSSLASNGKVSVSSKNTDAGSVRQPKLPTASRDQLELDAGLPGLRRAAMDADHSVQDAAGDLLTILANLDTTQRSARLVAETSLVAAGHAQIDCVQELVALERKALESRLEHLENLERVVQSVKTRDVRKDLGNYIQVDKRELGGASQLREDDDGGIASALAVLSSHVDWHANGRDDASASQVRSRANSLGDDPEKQVGEDAAAREQIETAVTILFDAALPPSDPKIQEAVDTLGKMATSLKASARSRRSTILYAINKKRSTSPKVPSREQFEGLSSVCASVLTGCCAPHSDDAVSSAKMCIMLSQTFYIDGSCRDNSGGKKPTGERSERVYIKSKLKDHDIWSNDDFWDETLGQQITESLTHSGVMSNFQKKRPAPKHRKSEWAQTFRTRWHDLNQMERVEAASQVQAVVFAQLGALAHSMLEFGCGLNRACSFVRRMAIRNQLPSSQRTMLLQHLIARNSHDHDDS